MSFDRTNEILKDESILDLQCTIITNYTQEQGDIVRLHVSVSPIKLYNIVFKYDNNIITEIPLWSNGTADYSWDTASVPIGDHSIIAEAYDVNTNTLQCISSPVTVTISQLTCTITSLVASPNIVMVGGSILLQANIQPTGTFNVIFKDGTTRLGTSISGYGVASFSWTTTGATLGLHDITAEISTPAACTSNVTIVAISPVCQSILLTTSDTVIQNSSTTLTATVTPAGYYLVQFKDGTNLLGNVISNPSGIATLAWTASAIGPHTLMADTKIPCLAQASKIVNVISPTQVLTSIAISPTTADIQIGATQILSAVAKDQNGNPMSGISLVWSSSDITKVTVSPSTSTTNVIGQADITITGISTGTVTIQATSGTITGTATIYTVINDFTVKNYDSSTDIPTYTIELNNRSVNPNTLSINTGDTVLIKITDIYLQSPLTLILNFSYKRNLGTTGAVIVTFNNGGTYRIQAEIPSSDPTILPKVYTETEGTITVNPLPVLTYIEISPATTSINIGDAQQFTAICKDQYIHPIICQTIIWSSDDTTIGTIDQNTGVFTTIAGGAVTIRATSDTIVGSAAVTVVTTGNLSISSTPSGAKIFINDIEQVDITTPVVINNLPPWTYNIKLILSGYSLFGYQILADYQWIGTVSIIVGQTTALNVPLMPLTGDVNITSTPPGAKIIVNDIDTGKTTPETIMGLSPGTYNYKLNIAEFLDLTGTFDIIAGQLATINSTQEPCPSTVPISVGFDQSSAYAGKTIDFNIIVNPVTQSYPVEIRDHNNNLIGTCTTSGGTCSISWNTTGLEAGTYVLITNIPSCTNTILPFQVTLLPECTSIGLSADKMSPYVGENVTFTVTTQPLIQQYPIEIRDQNNNIIGSCTTSDISQGGGMCTIDWNTTGLATGVYAMTASVISQEQCVSSPVNITLLQTCALVSITPDKMSANVGESIVFNINVDPISQHFNVELADQDNNSIGNACITLNGICSITWDTTGFTSKTYIITAKVIDGAAGQCIALQ